MYKAGKLVAFKLNFNYVSSSFLIREKVSQLKDEADNFIHLA